MAKGDVGVVAQGVQFPLNWENGLTRDIKSAADLKFHYDSHFTAEIEKIIYQSPGKRAGKSIRSTSSAAQQVRAGRIVATPPYRNATLTVKFDAMLDAIVFYCGHSNYPA